MKIKFEGKLYNDNRIFVQNYSKGSVQKNNIRQKKYLLITYRNTIQLPATRSDEFETKDELLNYIKKIEPDTPLISINGEKLNIPDNEDRWQYWLNWLKEQGLKSTITGFQNLPEWVKKDKIKTEYVTVLKD